MDSFVENEFNQENDPAAEFLAREQSQLAGIDDDLSDLIGALPTQSSEETITSPLVNGSALETEIANSKAIISPREEPEKLKKWRADQMKRLAEKDAEEERKKEEWKAIAKRELEEWSRKQDEIIQKMKASNRASDKQFKAETNGVDSASEWENIAKLCEFNPKQNRSVKDTSRMKSIMLQLKQNPAKKKMDSAK